MFSYLNNSNCILPEKNSWERYCSALEGHCLRSLAKREAGKPIEGSIGCATFENMAVHKGVHHTFHSRN